MAVRKLAESVYSVGAIDWDRALFDELIPLPYGTSYNSYLIQGSEATALIDTVDPVKADQLLANLNKLGIQKIDYVIANHAEQDHSGCLPLILEKYSMSSVVTNAKCKDFLIDLLHIHPDRFKVVSEGETLSLGNKTLHFTMTPWVHWPETMCSWLEEDQILFSCDFFGSHLAQSHLFMDDPSKTYQSAKRYFAEIMMPFKPSIKNNIKKLEKFSIRLIAPSHGVVYQDPEFILSAYRDWVSDRVANKIVILYVSMHGSTLNMVEHLSNSLIDKGLSVRLFNLINADTGDITQELVDAATLVLASPTVLIGPHPAAVYATYLVNAIRPKLKYLAIIGSFGWGGKMLEYMENLLTNIKPEILPPVIVKGLPKSEDYLALNQLADHISEKHATLA